MNNFTQIPQNNRYLNQRAYHLIKKGIIGGDYKPGEQLLETKIAEQFGISRTPVREACNRLIAEGLLEKNEKQHLFIPDFTIKDLKDVMKIREVLEGFAAYQAALVIEKKEIKLLESIIAKMKKLSQENNLEEFLELDKKFHEIVYQITKNQYLISMAKNISNLVNRFRMESLRIPGKLNDILDQHIRILEAIEAKERSRAQKLSHNHVETALKDILNHYKKITMNNSI